MDRTRVVTGLEGVMSRVLYVVGGLVLFISFVIARETWPSYAFEETIIVEARKGWALLIGFAGGLSGLMFITLGMILGRVDQIRSVLAASDADTDSD